MAKIATLATSMKTMSAKDAKNGFGRLLDTARAEPVVIEKHGRPVVVVMSVEEFERLTVLIKPGTGASENTEGTNIGK